jgi:hypothetical protein
VRGWIYDQPAVGVSTCAFDVPAVIIRSPVDGEPYRERAETRTRSPAAGPGELIEGGLQTFGVRRVDEWWVRARLNANHWPRPATRIVLVAPGRRPEQSSALRCQVARKCAFQQDCTVEDELFDIVVT